MLSSVLHSERAAQVNVEIMRTFVRLRELLSSHVDLARKLTSLEQKYDSQFKAVFDAIRALMAAPATTKRKIGFRSEGAQHPWRCGDGKPVPPQVSDGHVNQASGTTTAAWPYFSMALLPSSSVTPFCIRFSRAQERSFHFRCRCPGRRLRQTLDQRRSRDPSADDSGEASRKTPGNLRHRDCTL
jgi:hypothetical protein